MLVLVRSLRLTTQAGPLPDEFGLRASCAKLAGAALNAVAQNEHAALLEAGLAEIVADLPAPPAEAMGNATIERLLAYAELLLQWNRSFNLVRVASLDELLCRHVLDCAAAALRLAPGDTLDVGSGAGLPGMVIAILAPERRVTLVDSSLKRTRFLGQVQLALGLQNVCVLRCRVETLRRNQPVPPRPVVPVTWFTGLHAPPAIITARAFAPIARILTLTRHLCGPDTRIQLMKAELESAERNEAEAMGARMHAERYRIPGYAAIRGVVTIAPGEPI